MMLGYSRLKIPKAAGEPRRSACILSSNRRSRIGSMQPQVFFCSVSNHHFFFKLNKRELYKKRFIFHKSLKYYILQI